MNSRPLLLSRGYAPNFKVKKLSDKELINKNIYILSDNDLSTEIHEHLIKNADLTQVKIVSPNSNCIKILTQGDDSWLYNALQFEEIIKEFDFIKTSFVILASDAINPVFAKRWNRIAAILKINWIYAAIDGPFIFIGPTFEYNQTACYECFETRVAINLRDYDSYKKYKNAIVMNQIVRQRDLPMRGLLRSVLVSHLAMEVLNFILTGCNFTKNKVMSIYLPTMEFAFNEFLKVSNCETCGSKLHRDDHQLYFDLQKILEDAS